MSAPQGRFLSADPFNAGASLMDPQSWNEYAYVRNSPLGLVDPSGMDPFDGGDSGDCADDPFCGWAYWPPIIFPPVGDEPIPQIPAPPPPPTPITIQNTTGVYAQGQWGAYPNDGEHLGLPSGMNIPGPFGIGMPSPWILSVCPTADPNCVEQAQIALFNGADLINEIWLLRVTLGTLMASKAAPLPSSSAACQQYGGETYLGVSLQCFCSSAGDSIWSQQVRGCLASEHQYGTNPFVAHGVCYKSGGPNAPIGTLFHTYMACRQ